MPPTDRLLVWLDGEIKTPALFPEAGIEAGLLLRTPKRGERLGMPHSRPMTKNKRDRIAVHGWRFGDAAGFLGLTREEAALVETKLALSGSVRNRRTSQGLSQAELAQRLRSSQSRVAKMEAADPTVSADLLLRALFALGATPKEVALAIRAGR
jgi:DNA-binding transcriptional regulator YiaG